MIPGADYFSGSTVSSRTWRVGLVVLAFAALLTAFSAASRPVAAQGLPTEISGRVIQGTPDSELPVGLTVVLLVVDEERQEIISNESKLVGTNGEFTFTNILSGPGLTYRVAVDDDKYTPSVDLTPGESSFTNVEVTMYERTQSLDDVRISTYSMLVPSIDPADRLIGVLGVITVINSGNHVWVPDLENPNLTGFDLLRFNLPEGFTDLSVESDLPPGDILEIPTGFALTNPLPPGEFNILMTYIVEYTGDSLVFPLRLPYGADQVRIIIPEGDGDISGLGFGATEGVIIEDAAYSIVDGRDYSRDSQLDVLFSSLPTPSFLERTQKFFDGRGYIIAIAWVAGAAMLGLLVYAYFFSKQRARGRQPVDIGNYPEYEGLPRAEIVNTIATLDQLRDAGEIEDDDYAARRAVLTQAALSDRVTETQPT